MPPIFRLDLDFAEDIRQLLTIWSELKSSQSKTLKALFSVLRSQDSSYRKDKNCSEECKKEALHES
jgi:hypothetical protein